MEKSFFGVNEGNQSTIGSIKILEKMILIPIVYLVVKSYIKKIKAKLNF